MIDRRSNRPARAGIVSLAALLLASSVPAQRADLFVGRQHLTGGGAEIVFGDVDGDGVRDVVSRSGARLSVALGDGFGGLQEPVAYGEILPQDHFFRDHVLADVDGDGDLDLAGTRFFEDEILIRLNDGAGVFGPAALFPAAHLPEAMLAADLDGDGDDDLVVTTFPGEVCVLLSNGDGSFAPFVTYPALHGVDALACADLDADGELDLVVAAAGDPGINLLLGDGLGGFLAPVPIVANDDEFRELRVADVDADGQLDIAALRRGSGPVVLDLTVLLGDGAGGFPVRVDTPLPRTAYSFALGHLDADGRLDAAFSAPEDAFEARSFTMLGDGLGGFLPGSDFHAGLPFTVAILDEDQDGLQDLVFGCGDGLTVLRGDGLGGVDSLLTLPTDIFVARFAEADYDHDGLLDIAYTTTTGMSLRHGLPDGSFDVPVSIPTTHGSGGLLDCADFDGDGWDDLVVARHMGFAPAEVVVMLADGLGGFSELPLTQIPNRPADLLAADMNGDGVPDLLSVHPTEDEASLVHGDGQGGFGNRVSFATGAWPVAVGAADLNGDGALDLVTANDVQDALTVYLSADTPSGYGPALTLPTAVPIASDLVIADLNGDGHLDLTTGGCSSMVFLGDGHGGFSTEQLPCFIGASVYGVTAADLDGDLHPDLVVSDYLQNKIHVLHGDGTGRFDERSVYLAGGEPSEILVADLDGDAKRDLLVANNWSAEFTVHLNRGVWADLGEELGGTRGAPELGGSGMLAAGSPGAIELRDAPALAPSLLFGAFQSNPTPFKGGTLLPVPALFARAWTPDAQGTVSLAWAALPEGLPSGTSLVFQAAVTDPSAPVGVALSNGLRADVP